MVSFLVLSYYTTCTLDRGVLGEMQIAHLTWCDIVSVVVKYYTTRTLDIVGELVQHLGWCDVLSSVNCCEVLYYRYS